MDACRTDSRMRKSENHMLMHFILLCTEREEHQRFFFAIPTEFRKLSLYQENGIVIVSHVFTFLGSGDGFRLVSELPSGYESIPDYESNETKRNGGISILKKERHDDPPVRIHPFALLTHRVRGDPYGQRNPATEQSVLHSEER